MSFIKYNLILYFCKKLYIFLYAVFYCFGGDFLNKNENFNSNIGFVLSAIGSAIGFGTVWAFPYKMGRYGGFTFLAVYLIFAIFAGVSLIICELAIGRATQRGPVEAFKKISKSYSLTGVFAVLASLLVMIVYSYLGGYCLKFTVINFKGIFMPFDFSGEQIFIDSINDFGSSVFYCALFMLINFLIVKGGIQKGIEKFNIIAIPLLFIILAAVIIISLMADGADEGLRYMFLPDYAKNNGYINEDISIFKIISSAGSQLFFSLSIGMGATLAYGAHLKENANLIKNAVLITFADTLASVMSGLAVIPSAIAMGLSQNLKPEQIYLGGPKLLFVTLQNVFINNGRWGAVLGVVFFVLILIAAISSAVSLIEVVLSYYADKSELKGKKFSRTYYSFLICLFVFFLGVLSIKGFCGFKIFDDGKMSITDILSMVSESICMPVGAFLMTVILLFETKTDYVFCEIAKGTKISSAFKKFFNFSLKYFVPLLIVLIIFGALFIKQ